MNPHPAPSFSAGNRQRELAGPASQTPFYVGVWVDDEPCVTVTRGTDTVPLHPRGSLSKFGFGWGYTGPASAHLAHAILADFLASEPDGESRAERLHEEFHGCVVASLPSAWALPADYIADFLAIPDL